MRYVFNNIIVSFLVVLFIALLVGYVIYLNTKNMEKLFLQRKLTKEVHTDALTGISNRKHYHKQMAHQINLFRRYGSVFSILIIDIDHFKTVNDTYGHKSGDQVLIDLTEIVKGSIRQSDTIFRIGGEEFVVLLPNAEIANAMKSAEKIRLNIQKNLNTIEGKNITVSIGVAQIREGENEHKLFSRADACLYRAKNGGRNRSVGDEERL